MSISADKIFADFFAGIALVEAGLCRYKCMLIPLNDHLRICQNHKGNQNVKKASSFFNSTGVLYYVLNGY